MQSINRVIGKSRNAHGGFTVLELLVASLLLGMLMTVLTMIFNQSSIAWKTGVTGVANMDNTRNYVADMRYKTDNAYEWNGVKYIRSVFGDDGQPVTTRDAYISASETGTFSLSIPQNSTKASDSYDTGGLPTPKGKDKDNYIVNVRSWGPDRKLETKYDNIYSVSPSVNPEEW